MGYTNTYSNVTDDRLKKYPIILPWDSNSWDVSGNIKDGKITSNVLKELRQHAKAIEVQFNVIGPDPSYSEATDQKLASDEKIEVNRLHSSGNGLLDGINLFDKVADVSIPTVGNKIYATVLEQTRTKLESERSYSNYSNVNNSGYGRYDADSYGNSYSNHSNYARTNYAISRHTQHNRYFRTIRYGRASWYNYTRTYINSYVGVYYSGYARYGDWAVNFYSNQSYGDGVIATDASATSGYSVYNNYVNYARNDTPAPTYINTSLPNPGTYQNTL